MAQEFRPSVLLVHNRYRIPGGEDAVFEAERDLLAGHGHRVLCYERTNAELDGHPLRKLCLPVSAVYDPVSAGQLRALIRAEKPDLVHVHNTLSRVSPAVFRVCRAEGVPVVHTLHNFRLFCPNGILMRDGRVCEDCPRAGLQSAVLHRCYRSSALQSASGAAVLYLNRLLGTWRGADLIALTDFDRDKLLEFNRMRRVFDPARLHVKPNSVDIPDTPVLPMAARQKQFVFLGRLEPLKGIRTLLAAWDESLPPLLVAGDGPDEAWAKAHAAPNVRFLGRIPAAQAGELLAQSLCAVVPSLCYESFGLVAAEAHAAGTPVLASGLGNVGAMVTPGVNGEHFVPGDPDSLRAEALRMTQNALQYDPAAIRRTALGYAREENYRQLLEIYRKILQRS